MRRLKTCPINIILPFFQQSSLTEDCVFNEHQNCNAGWYLGLTKDGRAKPGPKTAPGQSAVEFSAENFDDHASWLLDL